MIKFFKRKLLQKEVEFNIGKRLGKLTVVKYIPPDIHTKNIHSLVECKCDCGNIIQIPWNKIKTKHNRSCGCFLKELRNYKTSEKAQIVKELDSQSNIYLFSKDEKLKLLKELKKEFTKLKIKHRDKVLRIPNRRPLSNKLCQMHHRCYDPKNGNYKRYGKRNIYICEEWRIYPKNPDKKFLNKQHIDNFVLWYNEKLKKLNIDYETSVKLGYSIDRIDNDGPYSPDNCRLVTANIQNKNKKNNVYYIYRDKKIPHYLIKKIFKEKYSVSYFYDLAKKMKTNRCEDIFQKRKDLEIIFKNYFEEKGGDVVENNQLKTTTYNESSIQSYDTRTGIRKKLSMYLGNIGRVGSFKAIQEIFLNSLDEYKKSNCYLEMIYETKNKIYTNFDSGRGIPLGKMEEILTTLHSGAKLDTTINPSGYEDSFGSNGCGLAIVTAISNWFLIECHREGKSKRLEFRDGYKVNEIDRDLTKNDFPHGTWIRFQLSEEVLKETEIDLEALKEAAELMSFTSPGFEISLKIDNHLLRYFSKNGLQDYFHVLIKRNSWDPLIQTIVFNFDSRDYVGDKKLVASAEVIFSFDKRPGNKIIAYTNRFKNIEGGSHVQGFKSGVTLALNKYMEDNEKIPKKYEKMNVSGSIINDNLIALISVSMRNPFFKNQTKDQLISDELVGWMRSKVYNLFFNWLTTNPKEADKLIKQILLLTEAKYAALQAKNKVLNVDKKESFVNSAISKRLEDCLSRNPEECELFIVEGESASVGSARDPKNQAYYLLRGKIFNSIASNKLEDDILLDFINMLGIGFGEKKNLNKLKYHKIILLADADEDGHHITALLLGFFYKYYPELINEGHIYIGNPPLYAIELNKKQDQKIFIKNIDHYNYILVQTMLNKFSAHADISGKEIPEDIFEAMLYGLIDYMNYLDNFSNQQNITPNLLETIVLYYKDIQKHNFKNIERQGYKVTLKESNETHKILEFDADIHHYNVNFNEKFYNTIYLPIISKIAKDIKIYNIHLKDRETKQIYKGSLYEYSQMMNKIFEGKISPKIKGLGEMKSEYLRTSVIDPETRNLTRVTMEDAEKATKIIETFLGKKYMDEKKAHFESSMEERKLRE